MSKRPAGERSSRKIHGPLWITPSRTGDYDYCEGTYEDKWLLGLTQKKSEPLKIGHDIHAIIFWFYKTIEDNPKLATALAEATNETREAAKEIIYKIYEKIVPDAVKENKALLTLIYNYAELDLDRLERLKGLFDRDLIQEDILKYFMPVLAEHWFENEDEEKSGILDRLDRVPPNYKLKGKSVKFMVGDYKSNTPNSILKALENYKETGKEKDKPKLTTRYRRQLSFYVDFCCEYLGFEREDFGVFVVFLDPKLVVTDFLTNRTYNSREERIVIMREKTSLWLEKHAKGKSTEGIFIRKPFYKKCRKCGRRDGCVEWIRQKGYFTDEFE